MQIQNALTWEEESNINRSNPKQIDHDYELFYYEVFNPAAALLNIMSREGPAVRSIGASRPVKLYKEML